MEDKQNKPQEEETELTDEKLDEVSGGRLIDWTPVELTPGDP